MEPPEPNPRIGAVRRFAGCRSAFRRCGVLRSLPTRGFGIPHPNSPTTQDIESQTRGSLQRPGLHRSAEHQQTLSPQGPFAAYAYCKCVFSRRSCACADDAKSSGLSPPCWIRHAIRAILSFSSALSHAPLAAIPGIYQAMLTEIASHVNPERPGRLEPRVIRRECHHCPSLRITRAQWKVRHHAA